jgi:tetratricopeptide (TPR) repeat protein
MVSAAPITWEDVTMSSRAFVYLAATAVAAGLLATPAMSAGGGGGSTDTPTCTGGKIWDKKTSKCVEQTGALDTDSLYEAGRAHAVAGRFGQAIVTLSLAADRGDPRVLNYLGYSHRMQGRVLVGLGYYQEALRVDPDYTLVREYMGEAYLQMGDLSAAEGQLREIEKRCGTSCDEFVELRTRIDGYKAGERTL